MNRQAHDQALDTQLESFSAAVDIAPERRADFQTLIKTIHENLGRGLAGQRLSSRSEIWDSFLLNERHHYAPSFFVPGKDESYVRVEMDRSALHEHLNVLYGDNAFPVYISEDHRDIVTMSQPSFVLSILHLLKLEKGHLVYEAGLGSGWNAALMDDVVGPQGRVVSVEFLKPVGEQAARLLEVHNHKNVECIIGDASNGYRKGPSIFDRVIYTASSWVIPAPVFTELKEQGIAVMPIAIPGGFDLLIALEKRDGALHSSSVPWPCGFVPLEGTDFDSNSAQARFGSIKADAITSRVDLPIVPRNKNTWTYDLKLFLSLLQKGPVAIPNAPAVKFNLGLHSRNDGSLAVVQDGQVIQYGDGTTQSTLLESIEQWDSLGQPAYHQYNLSILPNVIESSVGERRWKVPRGNSTFVWELKEQTLQDSS